MRSSVIGRYNEYEYSVLLSSGAEFREVYRAGNSHWDSQGYVAAAQGIGLPTMEAYCRQTAAEIAREHGAILVGFEYKEGCDDG